MKPPFGAAIFLPSKIETSYLRARACTRAPSFKQTVNDASADASLIILLTAERSLNKGSIIYRLCKWSLDTTDHVSFWFWFSRFWFAGTDLWAWLYDPLCVPLFRWSKGRTGLAACFLRSGQASRQVQEKHPPSHTPSFNQNRTRLYTIYSINI